MNDMRLPISLQETSHAQRKLGTDVFMYGGKLFGANETNCCSGGGRFRNSHEKWEQLDDANSKIAQELTKLSLEDRGKVFEDIHGVADAVEETEDFIREKMQSMQTAINWIKQKHAYEQAKFLLPASVEDRFLRLAVLRSTDYDPIRAAKRIVTYFRIKLEVFGLDNLVRPITFAELSEAMLVHLRSGFVQILPDRDRVGRPILLVSQECAKAVNDSSHLIGAFWYVYHRLLLDEVAQKKGYVLISFSFGMSDIMASLLSDKSKYMTDLDAAIPLKTSAVHYCYDNPKLRPFITIGLMAISKESRLRLRMQYGSMLECSYKMISYGIVSSSLPIDKHGNIEITSWLVRVEAMRDQDAIAAAHKASDTLLLPNSNDCLLGRGYPFQQHPGNILLIAIMQRNHTVYVNLERSGKLKMLSAIIWYFYHIKGGRFLKRPNENSNFGWVEASEEDAKAKISNVIRRPSKSKELRFGTESISIQCENGMTILVPSAGMLKL